jgi:hypothetical protein
MRHPFFWDIPEEWMPHSVASFPLKENDDVIRKLLHTGIKTCVEF